MKRQLSWFQGIQAKVIFKFLPVILLIPTLLAFVTYFGQKQSVVKVAKEHLNSVVTLKSHALTDFFSGGVESLTILSNSSALKELSELQLSGKQQKRKIDQALATIRGVLKGALRSDSEFDEFFVLDPEDGRVLVSTERENEGKIYRSRAFFREGLRGTFTDKVRMLPGDSGPAVYSAATISSYAGMPIGVLVGRHDLKSITVLMEELSVLGDTGDTYLFNENFLFLTEPRSLRGAKMRKAVFTDAARRALKEGSGTGIYKGIKNQQMVGAFRYMSDLGMGLIAEESLGEALKPLHDLRKNLIAAALLVTIFSLFALWVISRQIVRPLSKLSRAVTKFSDGDFSARADVHMQDEIGRLAENFNTMASSLEKLYGSLEEQVKKRTEELVSSLLETEEARAEWEDTFHAMNDSLFIYDEKGTLRRLNKRAEEMIGKKEIEVRGRVLEEVIPVLPPKDKEGFFPASMEMKDEDTAEIYRISHFFKLDSKGIPKGGVLVHRNITEEKRREQEYKEVQAQLLEASKLAAVGTLSAGVAHEFNNLIAGIRLHADLALNVKTKEKMERALQIAVESTERAAKIVSSLLVFSRRKSTEKKPDQLEAIVTETLGLIEADLNARGIELTKKFDPLPPVPIDRGQISQVILNLLTNARDAVLKKKDPQIKIVLRKDAVWAVLEVQDNGEGIQKEVLEKIFEPFFTTKGILGGGPNTTPGTGLGLSISYGIIQAHGGKIEVRSTPKQGTSFTVSLPIDQKIQILKPEKVRDLPREKLKISHKEVLVIDDEEHIRKALKEALEGMGHKVWLAKDGTEGLEMVRKLHPNILFIDLIMPGLSGTDLIQELKGLKNSSKIVAMSGVILEDEEPLYEMGVQSILRKPFRVSDLEDTFIKAFDGIKV